MRCLCTGFPRAQTHLRNGVLLLCVDCRLFSWQVHPVSHVLYAAVVRACVCGRLDSFIEAGGWTLKLKQSSPLFVHMNVYLSKLRLNSSLSILFPRFPSPSAFHFYSVCALLFCKFSFHVCARVLARLFMALARGMLSQSASQRNRQRKCLCDHVRLVGNTITCSPWRHSYACVSE